MVRPWFVYVLRSDSANRYYVGCTTNPARRIRQHNGEIKGGGRYTRTRRPWKGAALYGPYENQSEACRAEKALKKGKRGLGRTQWSLSDSKWCRGEGATHPWVSDPTFAMSSSN